MNFLNQNTYRAYVMVGLYIKNIDEMYLASSIVGTIQVNVYALLPKEQSA